MRRWVTWATLSTALFGVMTGAFAPAGNKNLPSNLDSAVLGAELVRDADDIYAVYGAGFPSGLDRPGNNAQKEFAQSLSSHTLVDVGLILSYGVMYVLLALALRRQAGRLGWFVAALAVIAVTGDLFENWALWRTAHGVVSNDIAWQTHFPSWIKWAALSAAWIGISELFWPARLRDGWQITRASAALLYFSAGCIGSWAVVFQVPDKIERAMALAALATLVQLSLLLFDDGLGKRITR
ncbi:MAG: hypothetical protein ACKV22_35435 [Bryobacteraceae bacterium]